ncbi:hypothetical protein [Saccharophagus degradans]|uniref:hypothetical protein n=1 Tax=Saccharophagus degradans TaxID=86304 RepID=UPI0000390E04|nr:hypothetical protein [Saccharophagus degradans]
MVKLWFSKLLARDSKQQQEIKIKESTQRKLANYKPVSERADFSRPSHLRTNFIDDSDSGPRAGR